MYEHKRLQPPGARNESVAPSVTFSKTSSAATYLSHREPTATAQRNVGDRYRFHFLDARMLRDKIDVGLFDENAGFAELCTRHPEMVVEKVITLSELCRGEHREDICAIGHRPAGRARPGLEAMHLRLLRTYLDQNRNLLYIWHEQWCVPHNETVTQQAGNDNSGIHDFHQLLYLGCNVLLLWDASCLFDGSMLLLAWLAVQTIDAGATRDGSKRLALRALDDSSKYFARLLFMLLTSRWASWDSVQYVLRASVLPEGHQIEQLQLDHFDALRGRVIKLVVQEGGVLGSVPADTAIERQPGERMMHLLQTLAASEERLRDLELTCADQRRAVHSVNRHAQDALTAVLEERHSAMREEGQLQIQAAAKSEQQEKLMIDLQQRLAWEKAEHQDRIDQMMAATRQEAAELERTLEHERLAIVQAWIDELVTESLWFRRWRDNASRLQERKAARKQRSEGRAALQLKLRMAQDSESETSRKLSQREKEMEVLRLWQSSLRKDLDDAKATHKEQEETLRLQRGFAQLRLQQVAQRFASRADQAASEQLGERMKSEMKLYEKLLREKEDEFEKEIQSRERELRERLRGEIKRELEKELTTQMKRREKVLQDQFRAELTAEIEGKYQAKIEQLHKQLKEADKKFLMYQQRLQQMSK